ncbi:MAG TPA: hypothetical protein VMI52_14605, partial [Acetobacteraceae bacterium]|nr:hypothetical protein [Acetobacteraceae bacterium]
FLRVNLKLSCSSPHASTTPVPRLTRGLNPDMQLGLHSRAGTASMSDMIVASQTLVDQPPQDAAARIPAGKRRGL